jgi:hypothetical protein
MIYSRFDDTSGLYDLYEDAEGRAVNSDLPIPVLGSPTNGIGVPASETGRPIPSGAKFVGKSWHARGMVAVPTGGAKALSGITAAESNVVLLSLAGLAAMGLFLFFWYSPPDYDERGEARR